MTPKQIVKEIRSYFNDTSRSLEATLAGLKEIDDELSEDIDSVENDLESRKDED